MKCAEPVIIWENCSGLRIVPQGRAYRRQLVYPNRSRSSRSSGTMRSCPSRLLLMRYWGVLPVLGHSRTMVNWPPVVLSRGQLGENCTFCPTTNLCSDMWASGRLRCGLGRIGASGLGCLETDCRNLSLLATLELVAQLLTLLEVADAGALDRRDMNEHVLRAVVRLDEAVTLLGVEPFNGTDTHRVSSIEF